MKYRKQTGRGLTPTIVRLGDVDRDRIRRIKDTYKKWAGIRMSMAVVISRGLKALEQEIIAGRGYKYVKEDR